MGQKKNGTVGTGDQNKWLSTGKIYETIPDGIPFKKTDPTLAAGWKDSACWTGGTPVTWEDDDIAQAEATTEKLGKIEMLVSRNSEGEIVEYHPLITFFNGVMSQIMRDGGLELLIGLDDPDNAVKLWKYLADKYPIESTESQTLA